MSISAEDSLKLNVLIANARAIRIDEPRLCVLGMTNGDDARVELNPTCPPEKYLRQVRELLSTRVLGFPRGYPVYLRRWTRMGDMLHTRLEPLLMIAEEEAVIAVARSSGLTDELATRAWWSLPTAEVLAICSKVRPSSSEPWVPSSRNTCWTISRSRRNPHR